MTSRDLHKSLMTPLMYEPQTARTCLLAIIESLTRDVAPNVQGASATRVTECVSLLLRMAQEISPSAETLDALQMLRAADATRPLIAQLEAEVLLRADEDMAKAFAQTQATAPAPRAFDAAGFERYLRSQPLGGPSTRVVDVRQLAGGRSKITTLVLQQGASDLPRDLIVRQDWAGGGVRGTTVVSEFALLEGVFAAGLSVPQPFLIERSNVLGAPFLVVARVPGVQRGSYFNPPSSEKMVLDLAEQLARLHRLPVEPFAAAGVPHGARTPEAMKAALDVFRSTQFRLGVPSPSVGLAIEWLERTCHRVAGSIVALVHNDIGAHNLMCDGESLSGILDWELAGIDHPAIDLGYAREWISRVLPWERFMSRYHAAGGLDLKPFDVDFYTLWSAIRVYALVINVRAAVADGHIRDMEVVHTALDAIPWLIRRICRELKRVLQQYPST